MRPPPRIRERADYGGDAPHFVRCLFAIGLGVMAPEKHEMSRLSINRPLTLSLSPSEGERVAGGRVKGRFKDPMHAKNETSLPMNNRWPGRVVGWVSCAIGLFFAGAAHPADQDLFRIMVVDEQTRRGVPLVELRTVNNISLWTDSNGIAAFNEPGLTGHEVYFHVRSDGYEYPKDGFGNRGVKLKPTRGGEATIKINRLNVAERLYRVTGEGIYRDSVMVGEPTPLKRPLLNGQVMGQDTVVATPYRGKIYWFWGDTERASYPLGNFAASGATSELPGCGGLDPSAGVDLTYFVDASGFSKPMCPDFGPGLQWIEGVMTVRGEGGKERLVARVSSQKGLVPAYAWQLAVFNDEKEIFESKVKWNISEGHDSSHPFRARVNGIEYLYLYPNWRVKADLKSLADPGSYEAFTCVAGDGKTNGAETQIDRDAESQARYSWNPGAARLHPGRIRELISAGQLKPEESWIQLRDFQSGAPVEAGRGSVCWNEFRQRWIMIVSSKPGEIWFAEADTPVGPWVYARRVVSHDHYNFYNPTQHPFFDQDGGRLIYFEGTYTASFSDAKEKTPRYDYNQIMYRLALDDARLNLPVPVYRVKNPEGRLSYLLREDVEAKQAWERIEQVAFFAIPPNRGRGGMIPIFASTEDGNVVLRDTPSSGEARPIFFALPPRRSSAGDSLDGAWECELKASDGGEFAVTLELKAEGERVSGKASDDIVIRGGSFKDGTLRLDVLHEERAYDFTAELGGGKLSGNWKRSDGAMNGTWSGTWLDLTPPENRSPAVVPLFEYRNVQNNRRCYSTNSALADKSLQRSAEPSCRVWNNPMSVLILDTAAQPVPVNVRAE